MMNCHRFARSRRAGSRLGLLPFALLWFSIATAAFGQPTDPEEAHAPPASGSVQVWLTTADGSKKLARQPDLSWSPQPAASANLTVDETVRFQEIDGFGATILDSSLWDAEPAVRDELMRLLFSRSSGIGLGMIRIPMGLSGLTGPHRTYNDLPSGQTDPTLSQFSIAGDQWWKLPMMQEAKRLNPELTLLGTPWSAPAWMKDSGSLGHGKLKPEYYGVYASYFVKWLDAWRAHGLGISAVTMQNEPHHEPYWYQGMRMEPADQAALGMLLGPAFKQAGHSTRILCWDHNCDEMSYPIAVMDDPVARNWIHGAAFHAYAGTTSDIYQFTDGHPDKSVYFTEQTGSYPSRGFGGSLAWHLRHIFLVPSLNGARCNLVWQLARRMEETLTGDRPFVRIAPDGKSYELHGEYYETGHFSKFVRKGARRIATNNPRDGITRYFSGPLLYAAYQNPDGSKSLVVLNESSSNQSFTVEDLGVGGRRAPYTMPSGAIATFHWRDATGGTGLAATYFDNPDLTGLSERRIDPSIDFTWAPETVVSPEFTRPAESPMHSLGPAGFSARWEGRVLPQTSELHTFHATSSDGLRLWVNGQLIIDQWVSRPVTETSGQAVLTANQPAEVKMEWFSSAPGGGGRVTLAWSTPTLARQVIPRERLFPPVTPTVPPPPLALTARAPGSSVQLSWAAAPAAQSYTIRRATSPAGPFSVLAGGITATSYSDHTTSAGTGYLYQVTAVNAQGEGAASAPTAVTPRGSTLSSPWQQQDIGAVGTAGVGGNVGDQGETVVLGGAGSDIWNTADSFRFAWLPLSGDGTIIARVASMENTSAWAKAGPMIRESLAANSAYVNIVCTPGNGVSFQSRAATGASATSTTVGNLFAPRWLKLTRAGTVFTGYHSMDGVRWTQTAAPVTVSMGTNVHIGLAVCSGQPGSLNLVQFDGISAPGLPLPRPPAPLAPEALPGNSAVNLAWAAAPYATSYEILRATVPGGPYTSLGTAVTTTFEDATAVNNITCYYIIRAANSTGAGPASAEVSATPRPAYLPAGWLNRDIGTVGLEGAVSLENGVYTIQAAGSGVWSTADGFNYSYRAANGDGSITVRVDSLTNVNPHATKSGLMLRSSSAPDASYAFLSVTPAGEVKFEYRSANGASAASQAAAFASIPRWLRLERSGGTIRAFSSGDGSMWTQLGGDLALAFAGDFLAGIAVASNNTGTRATSVLSQLSVSGFAGSLAPANLVATAGLDGVRLAWDRVMGATAYRVKRMATGEAAHTVIATVSETSYHDISVANRTTYSYVVTAFNVDGEGGASNPASVTTNLAPLPGAWSSQDVGSVGVAGHADHAAGTFTVRGAGHSITGNADSFHACSLTLSGDVTFTARVADVGSASGTAKVGIMLRESTASGARFAYIGVSPGGAMEFRYRSGSGGTVSLAATLAGQTLPRYLRLSVTRASKRSTFTAYHSSDGASWDPLGGSVQISNMPASILGSLVVCSMDIALLHTAVFDKVSATGHAAVGTPSGLVATVTPGTIDLDWEATPNAASYRVKRATTPGGPYVTLAQPLANSWQDTTAADHVAYYYVISALNAFAESANSAETPAIRETGPPAAPGRWLADTSGLWSEPTKWGDATPAGGTVAADFSTIDLTADRTVTVNAPVALPGMVFGDASPATAAGWLLENQGNPANTLTLAGSVPAIEVRTLGAVKSATISAAIHGAAGLRKTGPGVLSLAGFNPYAGGTVVEAGTLRLANGSSTGVIRGAVAIQAGATVLSTAASSFGWNPGVKVDSVDIQGGSLIHTLPGGTLTLSSTNIQMTGGLMDSTGSAGFDFFDASAVGGPSLNTSVTTLPSATPASIAGRINLRAGDNDGTGTVFTVADGAASQDLIVTADLVNGAAQGAASRVQKSGTGRLVLSGNNTYNGGTVLNAGTLVAASPTALGAPGTVTFTGSSGLLLELATANGTLANSHSLDMGSNRFNSVLVNRATPGSADYSLGTLRLGASTMTFTRGPNISGSAIVRFTTLDLSAGNNERPVVVNGDATLHIGNAAIISNPNISKRLQLDGSASGSTLGPVANGAGTGVLSLIKAGTGKWTLTGSNSHSGATTVQAGELALETATLADGAAVSVQTGGTLHLAFAGTDIVGSLLLGGVAQAAGTWGALDSEAPKRSARITGPGTLTVLPPAYLSWANASGLPSAPEARVLSADPDGDGLANSLEWVLGGQPLAPSHGVKPTLVPASSGYVFSFRRDPVAAGTLPLTFDWSDDLLTWHSIPVGVSSSGPHAMGITLTVTPGNGGPDRVDVLIPDQATAGNRIFLRINAGNP